MKIYKLTLTQDLKIDLGEGKNEYKKGYTFLVFTQAQFNVYVQYCEASIIEVESKEFIDVVVDAFGKDAKEILSSYSEDKAEAQKAVEDELARRKKISKKKPNKKKPNKKK